MTQRDMGKRLKVGEAGNTQSIVTVSLAFYKPSREMGADAEEEESHCNTWDGDVAKFSV